MNKFEFWLVLLDGTNKLLLILITVIVALKLCKGKMTSGELNLLSNTLEKNKKVDEVNVTKSRCLLTLGNEHMNIRSVYFVYI